MRDFFIFTNTSLKMNTQSWVLKSTRRAYQKKKTLTKFLLSLKRKKNIKLLPIVKKVDAEVWAETNCLDCSNCCRTMTPTFSKAEVRKIATHVGMTYQAYFDKYLKIDEDNGDIVNIHQPCQHLNLKTNMCNVYAIRPKDCSGFPHFVRTDFLDQVKVYSANLHHCPATLAFVEKLENAVMSK